MRPFQQLSFCLVTVLAISLTTLCGCDLGTYSQRSTEFLEANPGGMTKEMEMKMEKEMKMPAANETEGASAVGRAAKHLSRRA